MALAAMDFKALDATLRTNGSASVSIVCRSAGMAGVESLPMAPKAAAARDRTTLAGGLALGRKFLIQAGKPDRKEP